MKLKKLNIIAWSCLALTTAAHANEVLLTSNQPIKIILRAVHQNHDGQPVFGKPQSMNINKNVTIPINLNHYDLAGVMILSIDGHALPSSANQFNQPKQCTITTDKTKATGALALSSSAHKISCRTFGGIFG